MGGVEDGAARVIADDVVERGDVAVNSNFESSLARIDVKHRSELDLSRRRRAGDGVGPARGDAGPSTTGTPSDVGAKEESESDAWARATLFQVTGEVAAQGDAGRREAAPQTFARSRDLLYMSDMLQSDRYNDCRVLSVRDIAMLVNSRVNQQRCFAYEFLYRILCSEGRENEQDARVRATSYLMDSGLPDAILRDIHSSSATNVSGSLLLLSELLLPVPLRKFLLQVQLVGAASHGASGSTARDLYSRIRFQGDLIDKVSLDDLMAASRFAMESKSARLSLLKALVAHEMNNGGRVARSEWMPQFCDLVRWSLCNDASIDEKVYALWLLDLSFEKCDGSVAMRMHADLGTLVTSAFRSTVSSPGSLEDVATSLCFQYWIVKLKNGVQLVPEEEEVLTACLFDHLQDVTENATTKRILIAGHCLRVLGQKADKGPFDDALERQLRCGFNAFVKLLSIMKSKPLLSDFDLALFSSVSHGFSLLELLVTGVNSMSHMSLCDDMSALSLSSFEAFAGKAADLCAAMHSKLQKSLDTRDLVGHDLAGVEASQYTQHTWYFALSLFLKESLNSIGSLKVETLMRNLLRRFLATHRESASVVLGKRIIDDWFGTVLAMGEAMYYKLVIVAIGAAHTKLDGEESSSALVALWDCAVEAAMRASAIWCPKRPALDVVLNRNLHHRVFRDAEGRLYKEVDACRIGSPWRDTLDAGAVGSKIFVTGSRGAAPTIRINERDKDWANLDPEWLFHMSLYQAGARDFSHVILSCMAMEMHKSKYLLGLPTGLKLSTILHEVYCRDDGSPVFDDDSVTAALPLVCLFHAERLAKDYDAGLLGDASQNVSLLVPPEIVQKYVSISQGETLFGFNASLAFCSLQEPSAQLTSWRTILENKCFHFFPNVSWFGTVGTLFFGVPERNAMIDLCIESLECPSMLKAAKRDCITALFAFHCVASCCFCYDSGSGIETVSSKRAEGMLKRLLFILDDDVLSFLFRIERNGTSLPRFGQVSKARLMLCKTMCEGKVPECVARIEAGPLH